MAPNIEIVENVKFVLGEGPHWDEEAQVLYFVDILESSVFKYDASSKKVTRVIIDQTRKHGVTFVVPVAGKKNKFIIGYGRELALLTWDGISETPNALEIIVEVEHGSDTRFNDGKVDARGRLWAGTMALKPVASDGTIVRKGSLYSLNKNGAGATNHITDIGISNGLAWSSDNKIFYFTDSLNYTIEAFDYDIELGQIKNRRLVFDLKKHHLRGIPDGMTIDKENKLWLVNHDGGAIHHIDPVAGNLLCSIELPAAQVTSAAWGGTNLDELYVTSATLSGDNSPQGGRLFKITGLGASGYPSVPVTL